MSRLDETVVGEVPDSRNNFCHYFALLSIEHFFALVA